MDKNLIEKLNAQFNKELHSAYIYYSLGAYFKEISMDGFHNLMINQAKEELDHANKFYNYLLSVDEKIIFDEIKPVEIVWVSPTEAIREILNHEKYITDSINDLYKLAKEVGCNRTEVFLHWFITEQIEEEEKFKSLLDRMQNIQKYECEVIHINDNLSFEKNL